MLSISAHCIVQVGNNCNYIFCSVSLLSELSRRMVRHCNWIKSNAEPWMCVRTNDKLHSVQFVRSNSGDRQWGARLYVEEEIHRGLARRKQNKGTATNSSIGTTSQAGLCCSLPIYSGRLRYACTWCWCVDTTDDRWQIKSKVWGNHRSHLCVAIGNKNPINYLAYCLLWPIGD